CLCFFFFFFFQAEDGIRDLTVTGVQTCALPISPCDTPCAAEFQIAAQWRSLFAKAALPHPHPPELAGRSRPSRRGCGFALRDPQKWARRRSKRPLQCPHSSRRFPEPRNS